MDNYISYSTHGQSYTFKTGICFAEGKSSESIAVEIYHEVRKDSKIRMDSGEITPVLSKEEIEKLPEKEREKYKTTNIEFVDTHSNKKLSMKHMFDIYGLYKVESLTSNE